VAFKFLNVLVLNKAEKLPTKNLIEPKLYMNPTKNLIEPKLYMSSTKNLIEPKPYMNPTSLGSIRFLVGNFSALFKTRTFKNLNATGKVMGRDR
jgi:hypothetical protein